MTGPLTAEAATFVEAQERLDSDASALDAR